MEESMMFPSEEFGSIRIIIIDGVPWFVAIDICRALGYKNPRTALAQHVDECDKKNIVLKQDGGSNYKSKVVIINESGFYALVIASKLPTAQKFRRWVLEEVLPSIRKTGGYGTVALPTYDPANLQESERENEELRPKAEYCDKALQNKSLFNISILAKSFRLSAQRLNQLLCEWGVQFRRDRDQAVELYARYKAKGYADYVFNDIGNGKLKPTLKWTSAGFKFLTGLLEAHGYTRNSSDSGVPSQLSFDL